MAAIIFPHTKWLPKITDYRDTAALSFTLPKGILIVLLRQEEKKKLLWAFCLQSCFSRLSQLIVLICQNSSLTFASLSASVCFFLKICSLHESLIRYFLPKSKSLKLFSCKHFQWPLKLESKLLGNSLTKSQIKVSTARDWTDDLWPLFNCKIDQKEKKKKLPKPGIEPGTFRSSV